MRPLAQDAMGTRVPGHPRSRRRADEHERRTAFELAIQTERVRYLVRQAPTGFAGGIVAVAIVVLVLWNAAPHDALVLWLATIALLTLPAPLVVWRFLRSPDVSARIGFWYRALAVVYALAGTGWGAAAFILYPRVETPFQLFLLFIVGGAGVSGMAALAPIRTAFLGYVAGVFVPMIAVLLAQGSLSSVATGLLLLAFGVSIMVLGSRIRDLLVGSLRLRFENLELIDDLSTAKDAAEAAS